MSRQRLIQNLHQLSVRAILNAGDGDHTDGGGLLLRVRGASTSWVFRYTAPNGRRREMGLGIAHRASSALATASLTAARDLSHQARDMLVRGLDPIDERSKARDAGKVVEQQTKAEKKRRSTTLAAAARDYHERVIEPSRSPKHAAQWISSLENHLPAELWKKPVDEVTAPALLKALLAMTPHERARNTDGGTPQETQQRVRQRLDSVFEDAIFHGLCKTNPAAAIKRKLREAQKRRDRGQFAALPYREAPAFMAELRTAEGIAARCLEFALLTAARTAEALLATWNEFDLDAGQWVLPGERMKGKEAHTVHLSPRALEIVKAQRGLSDTYVFPSPMLDDKPLSNMAMLTVLGRMGYRDRTTVHGLCRATFSTWANETGAARPDVIEACLAHEESNRVRAAYNRAEFAAERRALLEAWATFLATPAASNVVPLLAA